jgi:hypothetical protein
MKAIYPMPLLFIFYNSILGQEPIDILKEFQNGNMTYVAKYSSAPFSIQNIGPAEDTILLEQSSICKELVKIRDIITQEVLNKSTIVEHSTTSYSLVFSSYNCQGELESESALTFYFRSGLPILLYRIMLSG